MSVAAVERAARMRQVINLERADRLSMGDYVWAEYRPDVYHLGEGEPLPPAGEIGLSRDGSRRVTRDGGVWPTDARERYRSHEDVLAADLERFRPEEVAEPMLSRMAGLLAERADRGFVVPLHYGTLISRATIEFGWEPFLMASALEPERFARVLDCFGAASLAVAQGWAQTDGVELIAIHDDIAGTRGLMLSPDFLRRYSLPWYRRIFAAIHERGRKVLYVSDGNYLPFLDDMLTALPDGLYIESSSMDPAEFVRRAGPDRIYLIKTNNRTIDAGTPEAIRRELLALRDLHREHPGMMIYRGGGNPAPGNAEAFDRCYRELLVYGGGGDPSGGE